MSELRVNSIADANGNYSSTMTEVSEGRAKAHCCVTLEYDHANGPLAFRGSYNIVSAIDFGTARVRFEFKNAMSDTNYTFIGHTFTNRTSWADGYDNQDEVGIPCAKYQGYCFLGGGDLDSGANGNDPDGYVMTIFDNSAY